MQSKMRKKKQFNLEFLRCIHHYYLEHKYSPVVREMQEMMNWASTSSVHYNLKQHSKRGYLIYTEGRARTVRLTKTRIL